MNVGNRERFVSASSGAALTAYGLVSLLKRRLGQGIGFLAVGSGLLYRGVTGNCPLYSKIDFSTESKDSPMQTVEKSVLIQRSSSDLYQFWHDFARLPEFMENITSVTVQDKTHTHWTAQGPLGKTVEWDAEIVADEPNRRIAWQSLPGADVDSAGSVTFTPGFHENETRVTVSLSYRLPLGAVGTAAATLIGVGPEKQLDNTLRRFKSLMEADEIPTTHGQPSGPRSPMGRLLQKTEG